MAGQDISAGSKPDGAGRPRDLRLRLQLNMLTVPLARALIGLGLLLVVGGLLEPRTLAPGVLLSMLPFAAILGVAAVGQHLVIQQRGFDLSVAGTMSASAVLLTNLAGPDASLGLLLVAILATLAFGALAGLMNGLFVNRLGVTPLVTTIGTNALLLGVAYWYSTGVPVSASGHLTGLLNSRTAGVPNTALVALAIFALGRKFIAVGVNPATARALAIPVNRYQVGTYVIAGMFFAAAAVLLSGVLTTPTLLSGTPYMLTTVAAVVVGGNPLNGDKGSLAATLVGALFLTFLNQLVVSMGFAQSVQNITQAVIILVGVAGPSALRSLMR